MNNLTQKLDQWIERRAKNLNESQARKKFGRTTYQKAYESGVTEGANELKAIVVKLAEAHNKNADEDFRGNRTTESVRSFNALKELEELLLLEKE